VQRVEIWGGGGGRGGRPALDRGYRRGTRGLDIVLSCKDTTAQREKTIGRTGARG